MAISLVKKPQKPAIFAAAILFFAALPAALYAAPTAPDTPVYVVGKGIKYHSPDCTYAKSPNARLVKLEDVPNCTPCGICWRTETEKKFAKNADVEKVKALEKKIAELTAKIKELESENAKLKKAAGK